MLVQEKKDNFFFDLEDFITIDDIEFKYTDDIIYLLNKIIEQIPQFKKEHLKLFKEQIKYCFSDLFNDNTYLNAFDKIIENKNNKNSIQLCYELFKIIYEKKK